ncbi:MAG: TlpA disulfide reductase family protein [Proteobacteria bacterium]|nr:TlpA disulfide reductase family protein [Pseudomonadota bacterium]
MNFTKVRKVVTAASALAALVLIPLVVAKYWFYAPPNPEAQPAPVAVEAKPSTGTEFSFPLLDEPRTLPELRFLDGEARALTLSDFQGKLVLLNIWATWCVPCRREMPTLDRLQAKLGGPDFEVVALSIDRGGVEAVNKFYNEIAIKNLKTYIDSALKATRTLKVVGLPTTLLIDNDGREIGRLVGPAEWDTPEMISFLRKQINKPDKTRGQSVKRSARQ